MQCMQIYAMYANLCNVCKFMQCMQIYAMYANLCKYYSHSPDIGRRYIKVSKSCGVFILKLGSYIALQVYLTVNSSQCDYKDLRSQVELKWVTESHSLLEGHTSATYYSASFQSF